MASDFKLGASTVQYAFLKSDFATEVTRGCRRCENEQAQSSLGATDCHPATTLVTWEMARGTGIQVCLGSSSNSAFWRVSGKGFREGGDVWLGIEGQPWNFTSKILCLAVTEMKMRKPQVRRPGPGGTHYLGNCLC